MKAEQRVSILLNSLFWHSKLFQAHALPVPILLCSSYTNTTSTSLNKLICVDAVDDQYPHSLRNTASSFKAQIKYQLLFEGLPHHHV